MHYGKKYFAYITITCCQVDVDIHIQVALQFVYDFMSR